MRCFLPLFLLFAVPLITPTRAQSFVTEAGRAEFTSSVPLHTFTGTSDQLVGRIDLATGTVDFYLDLETLDTGIGKRDKDMRETLETGRFPFAEFFGTLTTPFDPSSRGPQPVRVQGTFKLHGVEREVEIEGTLQQTADGLTVEAAWNINLDDYGIVPPRLLVIKVDEVQAIRIEALLSPENS